jgi:uncharacterized protein (TIGR02271 family)
VKLRKKENLAMAIKHPNTVATVFADPEDARNATRALKEAGFTEQQIGVAGAGVDADDDASEGSQATQGALAGAATGAGLGALWGLGILAGVLPAIGPAIAGGTLAVLLSSAAAGAAAAGLAGALIGMGFSRDEAEYYEGELKAGRTIVTVEAGTRRDEAVRLLRQHHGYDFENREASSSRPGKTERSNLHAEKSRSTRGKGDTTTVQAHEEQLDIRKEPVETGEVRVRKEVHTERKTLEVPVMREEVVVERWPASGQEVRGDALQGKEEIRIPVREEQVQVDKRTVVAEEVAVGKRSVSDTKRVQEDLRKEEIKVDTQGQANVQDRR